MNHLSASETFPAVCACAIALLAGAVLQAAGVSAGNGRVIDWRTEKCGDEIQTGGDPFETAQLFVTLVGPDVALAATEVAPSEPFASPPPVITAFMQASNGGRRRHFTIGAFDVYVEPHEDDAAQAAFTLALATLAQTVQS